MSSHEEMVALADRLNCGEITAEEYFAAVDVRAGEMVERECAHRSWIETETIGPRRALSITLAVLAVITGLVWTVALVLLAVAVSR